MKMETRKACSKLAQVLDYDGPSWEPTVIHTMDYVDQLEELLMTEDINASDDQGKTLLHYAVRRENVEAVRRVLAVESDNACGLSVNINARDAEGKTALMMAAGYGCTDIVQTLLDAADQLTESMYDRQAEKKIKTMDRSRGIEIISTFTHKTVVYVRKRSQLFDFDKFRRRASQIDTRSKSGESVLMHAARGGYSDVVNLLLRFKPNLSACDQHGLNALHMAVFSDDHPKQRIKILDALFNRGLNINAPAHDGETPLHLASRRSAVEVVEYLLACGASVNSSDASGGIPAHAIHNNKHGWKIQPLLLGADPRLVNISLNHELSTIICPECKQKAIETNPTFTAQTAYVGEQKKKKRELFAAMYNTGTVDERFPGNILEHWYRYMCQYTKSREIDCPPGCDVDGYIFLLDLIYNHSHLIDKRGRTVTHLLLLLFCSPSAKSKLKCLAANIKNIPIFRDSILCCQDYCGRTVLHYMAILSQTHYLGVNPIQGMLHFREFLETVRFYRYLHVKDKHDRTPRNYAYIKNDTPTIYLDTPILNSDIKYWLQDGLIIEQTKCYSNQAVIKLRSDCLTERVCNSTSFFLTLTQKWNKWSYQGVIASNIYSNLTAIINRLVAAMQTVDPLLEARVVSVGSAYEGTRAGHPKEFDIDVVLTAFSTVCEISSSPVCPNGYALLKKNTAVCNNERLEGFFDASGFLIIFKLRELFETNAKKILRRKAFWKDDDVFELVLENDWELYVLSENHVCMTLKLVIIKPIDGKHTRYQISVDIVPCIQIKGFWPDKATRYVGEGLKSDGCLLVFDQPQKVYPWIPVSIPYARISFAPTESSIIRSCSAVVKAAYIIAKNVVEACRSRSRYSSYVLKTAVLYSRMLAARNQTKRFCRWFTSGDTARAGAELQTLTKELFLSLLQLHRQIFIPAFYMPSLSLRLLGNERFLRQHAVWLHSYLTSVKDESQTYIDDQIWKMFTAQEKSNERIVCDVIQSLQNANTFYWTCCDEGETVSVITFSNYINPLVECCAWNSHRGIKSS